MQFQVPQFIDIEDKIFGPLTLKQFLYLCGAGAVSFLLFFTLTVPVWIGFSVVLMGFAAGLAFIRINGQPLSKMLVAAAEYIWLPKFYLWHFVSPQQEHLPVIHQLPAEAGTQPGSPLKNLLLKFNTARGAVNR